DYQVSHPYIKAFDAGIEQHFASNTQKITNLKYLSKALFTGNWYGYDSQEYLDLIDANREEQNILNQMEENVYKPPTFLGQLIKSGSGALVGLPEVIALGGSVGLSGLPLMTFTENLHLGLPQASEKALITAMFVGGMHGLG